MRVLSHQLLITAEDKCVRVDLPEYILLLRWIHDLLHSLLNNAYRYLLHLVALCCVFHEELIWGKTLYFDRFLELLHIVFQRYLRFVHEQSREHWHLDVIKPVQPPLNLGIREDLSQRLRNLSLHVDRFVTLHEFNNCFLWWITFIGNLKCFLYLFINCYHFLFILLQINFLFLEYGYVFLKISNLSLLSLYTFSQPCGCGHKLVDVKLVSTHVCQRCINTFTHFS